MSFGRRRIPKHLIIEDYPKKSHGYGWILLAVGILLASMLLSLAAKAQGNLNEHEIYQAKAGQLMLQSGPNIYQPAVLLSSDTQVEISGLVAHVSLSQTFVNQTDQWQEAVYVFPLAEDAAVNHMEMIIGERVIVGEIKEKAEAKKIYQQAKSSGKRAALTQQLRPNMFVQRVANIPPQQSVIIRLTYLHTARFDHGEFSWHMPMTITPRYFPRENIPDSNIRAQTNSNAIKVSTADGWANAQDHTFEHGPLPASVIEFHDRPLTNSTADISISLNSGLALSHIGALFHDVVINKSGDTHTIRLAQGRVNMDRDFVLTWRPVASQSPQAALFTEEVAGDNYSLLMVLPPQQALVKQALPRDVIFVLDISGSMQGASIRQAKESIKLALKQLSDNDRFNIIAFNSQAFRFRATLELASDAHINSAIYWIDQLDANGGTEMLPALDAAFKQFGEDGSLQQTIFITDGAVGNESALFQKIVENLQLSRLFTVGIGAAPNSYFMKKAAKFGRGTHTFINDDQQISEKINALFNKLNSAVAKDIAVTWPDDSGEIYPRQISDLYLSEPILVATKSANLKGDVLVEGITAAAPWQQYISLENHRPSPGIATLWARKKIEALEESKVSGANQQELKQSITAIALKHQLLSRYTSFVAVEQTPSRPTGDDLQTSPIQNALPKGQARKKMTAVHYPASATNAEISWWFGLFCLTIAIVIRRMMED